MDLEPPTIPHHKPALTIVTRDVEGDPIACLEGLVPVPVGTIVEVGATDDDVVVTEVRLRLNPSGVADLMLVVEDLPRRAETVADTIDAIVPDAG